MSDWTRHRATAEKYLREAESAPAKTAEACASIAAAHALLALLARSHPEGCL